MIIRICVYQDNMFHRVFADFVTKAKQLGCKTGMNENCYLDQILEVDDVDERDKLVTLIDLVAAGIETVHFRILTHYVLKKNRYQGSFVTLYNF